jgi:GNAT superfamily N-acetyltransferase
VTLHADSDLAARIEAAVVEDFVAFGEQGVRMFPEDSPCLLEVSGGVALFLAAGSPMNQATGLGFAGPVSSVDIVDLEEFFTVRGTEASLMLAPLAHPSLVDAVAERGFSPTGFENVLGLELSDGVAARLVGEARAESAESSGIVIREARSEEERALWARANIEGFVAPLDPTPAHLHLAQLMAARTDMVLLLALADGQLAGSSALRIRGGDAWLLADSTLPEYRRRGVQQALQRHRVGLALEAGCEVAFTEARPGGSSQRNMERIGFRVLYTRVDVVAPTPRVG